MKQSNADSSAGFQTQANADSQVNQAAQDINQINQTGQGSENQTIGQVYGGVVVYVSGGQAVINPSQRQGSQSGNSEAEKELGPNPYKGLLAFHEKDQDLYFGRSREVAALWNQFRALHEQADGVRLLPIYGPSGSGKSSLARAGLIPELGKRPLPGRARARIAVMVPGTKPLQALAGILAQIAEQDAMAVGKVREFAKELALANDDGEFDGLHRIASLLPEIATFPLVVLVDQFEEVYSLCEDVEARDALVANLLYAAQEHSRYVSVLLTMRSDFLGGAQNHPQLDRLLSNQGFYVPSMDEEALREVIAMPADRFGYPLDDATIQLLIKQTERREGALPLLQFALTRIWEELGEGNTPVKTLEKIGGVGGALAGEAQRVYDELSKEEQEIARRLFLGLIQLGEGTQDTRRRASVSVLMARADQPEQFRQVMERFTAPGVRLVTVSAEGSAETAEVTHEALFEHWQALKAWLNGSRDDLRFQQRLSKAAMYWDETNRPAGLLWRNPDLGLLRSYHKRLSQQMNDISLTFFNAAVKREKSQQIVGWFGASLLTLLAGGMTWLAIQFRQASQLAQARQFAAQSQQVSNSRTGLLLALEAQELLPNGDTELGEVNDVLREHLTKLPSIVLPHEDAVFELSFSPDGKHIATASNDGTGGLWEVETGKRLATLNHEGVIDVNFSPDGKHIATTSRDGTGGLWKVKTGKRLATLNHEDVVTDASFSPDGTRLATTSFDGTGRLWEVETGKHLATLHHDSQSNTVNFSPDGKHIAYASFGVGGIWELESGKQLATLSNHEAQVSAIRFSPDSQRITTINEHLRTGGTWIVESGKRIAQINLGDWDGNAVSISLDGTRIATTSRDGTVEIWDVERGKQLATLNIESWIDNRVSDPLRWVHDVSFSPDGKLVAIGSRDGTGKVWEVESRKLLAILSHEDNVLKVRFSPDGKRIATTSEDGTGGVWEIVPPNSQDWLWDPSMGGKGIAATSQNGTARVWEVKSGKRLATFKPEEKIIYIHISPDGKRIATTSRDGMKRVHWLWSRELVTESCKRLHRNLSASEWKEYRQADLSQYRLTCENRPIHPTVLGEVQKLAESGQVRESVKLYRHLLKVARDAEQSLDLNSSTDDMTKTQKQKQSKIPSQRLLILGESLN